MRTADDLRYELMKVATKSIAEIRDARAPADQINSLNKLTFTTVFLTALSVRALAVRWHIDRAVLRIPNQISTSFFNEFREKSAFEKIADAVDEDAYTFTLPRLFAEGYSGMLDAFNDLNDSGARGLALEVTNAWKERVPVIDEVDGFDTNYWASVAGQQFKDKCRIGPVDFSFIDFGNCSLNRALFEGTNLSFAEFQDAKMAGTRFYGCDMICSSWSNADLAGTEFHHECNLNYADLKRASLSCARFSTGTRLYETDFSGADLRGTIFIGVDLTTACFKNSKLDGAMMIDCKLSPAQELTLAAKVQRMENPHIVPEDRIYRRSLRPMMPYPRVIG